MSSFAGRMKEYPIISLDRFDRENLHARAYFLSHCHKDHMKGLKGPLLRRKLKFSLTVKLYCSFVTKELLLNNPKYAFWQDHIVALELDSPTHISLVDEITGESEDVVVTLLPAGHCPGSVMFLFEGAQGTVLYTGDFRMAIGDAARMEYLHSGDRVKDIQSVYLDTTFFDPKYHQIPSREACSKGIMQLVQDWICKSPYHVVWLNCKAAYGYEYLFTNLGQEFSSQIHVNSLEMFKKMPEILYHMTTNRATQIHACRHPKDEEIFRANRLPCGSIALDGTPLNIISIKPSTIWFGERTKKTSVIVKMGGSSYRACFSFHSSYSEVKDFLSHICPVNIYPNVIPMGQTLEDVTELLKPLCRKHSGREEIDYKPLGNLKRTRKRCTSHGSGSDNDLFDEVAMAPRRRKMALTDTTKVAVNIQSPNPNKNAPDKDQIYTFLECGPSVQTSNYMDCAESNDDDDDDDDELSNITAKKPPNPSDVASPPPSACSKWAPPISIPTTPQSKSAPPCWEKFFTAVQVLTDESELECSQNSQTTQTLSNENTASPELFQDDDDDENNSIYMTSSQSTHISDAGPESLSQMDTVFVKVDDSKVVTSDHCNQVTNGVLQDGTSKPGDVVSDMNNICNVEPKTEKAADPKSDSQVSSDFELPPTPGSEVPLPEDLKDLYWKLAAGEEVVIRKRN
ncbi:protein artemis-like isoform X1 [Myxocyprinus asiaticus]|uniref:protein artemis-like isoform X1 n=2 Tax=Myxocyprinus asiaticus TaxID=70543 RepID=UPI0022231F01|nr:protein artemis-like isoform X1 [Myxocyprinus asiaticus]